MKKEIRAKVVKTGRKIKVEETGDGRYIDISTGMIFDKLQIDILPPPKRLWGFGFHFLRFGLFFHFRHFFNLNSWYIIPGVAFEPVNGYDRYFDLELRLLCFGFGIRFIYVKKKNRHEN